MNEEDFHRVAIFYADEIEKCPEFGVALKHYMSILEVVKNIRALCHEDSPEAIKGMIGKKVNGFEITEETYQHARVVDEEYSKRYEECKRYLKKLSGGESDLKEKVEHKSAKTAKAKGEKQEAKE